MFSSINLVLSNDWNKFVSELYETLNRSIDSTLTL